MAIKRYEVQAMAFRSGHKQGQPVSMECNAATGAGAVTKFKRVFSGYSSLKFIEYRTVSPKGLWVRYKK